MSGTRFGRRAVRLWLGRADLDAAMFFGGSQILF